MNNDNKEQIKLNKRERLKLRITEIDAIRGICVLLMIVDHFMYDAWGLMPMTFKNYPLVGSFWEGLMEAALWWWRWPVRVWVRHVVVFLFLAITGVSCSFSKSNLKRGLMLMGIALFITLVTFILGKVTGDNDTLICFGILHLIAFTILVVYLIGLITQNKWVYLAIGAVLVTVGAIFLKEEYVSYSSGNFFELFFKQFAGLVLVGPDGYSFPFYGGQIFIGVFLGKLLYKDKKSLIFKKGYSNNPLTFVGRHALFVYIAHQIIIPLVLVVAVLLSGYTLNT